MVINVLKQKAKCVSKTSEKCLKKQLELVGKDNFFSKKNSSNKIQRFCKQKIYKSLLSASTE